MAATVFVQQPYIVANRYSSWSSGLCDCGQDMNSCCYAFWCCPCFACSTTGEFGESTCLPLLDMLGPGFMAAFGAPVCVPPVTLGMRVAIRHKYEIQGSICEDIMVSCCCIWCSWCQMSREIKDRKKPITIITTQPVVQSVPNISTTTTTHVVKESYMSPPQMGSTYIMTSP
ncbi:placenta-specific gene 8 protein-like [Paramisgurnus dabryanus]|uniref:placenta-specific gene 8 protein-like n=1 Tax=Paramisgurnus dabryanus TaxID=90735 RepID=UPI0031F3B8D6